MTSAASLHNKWPQRQITSTCPLSTAATEAWTSFAPNAQPSALQPCAALYNARPCARCSSEKDELLLAPVVCG
eukprot:12515581-Alexandrium_andersonii.AAC.1